MQHKEDYLYDLALTYNKKKLQEEIADLNLEPYFADNPNKDSWFAGPKSWLTAEIPKNPNTEIDKVSKQLSELLGTKSLDMIVLFQKANTSVPVHTDKVSKKLLNLSDSRAIRCGVNIQLNDAVGPVNFPDFGLINYECALLNIMEKHGVPEFPTDRLFIKFRILDISYKEARNNYINSLK